MCGISGFIGFKDYFPKKEKIKNLLKFMKRRGPDGKGTYIKKFKEMSLIFLHTRLSIIDLQKKSNQPFEDERGVLSFNGEIYNYLELREICVQKGIKFKTHSDTEVLLKMLNLYGEKVFKFLDGMWSFSYYDKKNNKIILSRDRFGEKPFYYIKEKKYFVFGSNISYLNFLLKKKITLDKQKISDFLLLGFKSLGFNRNTIFNKVKTLRPGSMLVVKLDKKLRVKRKNYWKPRFRNTFKHSYDEAIGVLKERIFNVFLTRFRSDVPLTSLLSGGMDSSSILSVAKETNVNLKCFSIRQKLKEYNEDESIKTNIEFSKVKHQFVKIPKKNNLKMLKELVKYQSYPLSTPQAFATATICKKVKSQGYKVLLSGTGGDELFAGNFHHYLGYLYSIKGSRNFNEVYRFWKKNISKYIRSKSMKNFYQFKKITKRNIKNASNTQHEDNELRKYIKSDCSSYNYSRRQKDIFLDMMLRDLRQNSIPHQLDLTDNMSMYYSIEARAPFLSNSIYDFISTLPKDFFFRGGRPKSLLRDAMEDYVPKTILNDFNKIGFYISFSEIFPKKVYSKLKKMILNSNLLKDILNLDELNKLFKKKNLKHSESKFLFAAVNVAILGESYQ